MRFLLTYISLVCLVSTALGQQFQNPDLEGFAGNGELTALPEFWDNVPAIFPFCLASLPGITDTPDLTLLYTPEAELGIIGTPVSGYSFVSGLNAYNEIGRHHEGIQQLVSDFEIDSMYTISFYQSVIKQEQAFDPSARWGVYKDDELIEVVAPSFSAASAYGVDNSWDFRAVSFQATASSHLLRFLPLDDDANQEWSWELNGGIRMGIDSIYLRPECLIAEPLVEEIAWCDQDSVVLSVSSPDATYTWQDGSTSPEFIARDTGYYNVIIRGADGCLSYQDVNVLNSEIGSFDLGPDSVLCSADEPILLGDPIDNPLANYTWQDGSNEALFLATHAGSYILEIELGGCIRSDTVNIIPSVLEAFSIGNDTTICAGNSLTYSVPTFHPSVNYAWHNSSTESTITITEPIIVQLTASVDHCTFSDSVQVTPTFPNFSLGDDQLVCPGENVELDATLPGTNITYLWQDGSTDPILVASGEGEYSVEISRDDCQISDTILIEEFTTMTTNLGPDTLVCPGTSAILSVDVPEALSFIWSDQTIGNQTVAIEPGLYTVTVSLEGCEVVDSILVSAYDFQPPEWPEEIYLCNEEPLILDAFSEEATYIWQDGSTASSYTVSDPGNYGVQIFFEECTQLATVNVLSSSLNELSLGSDTTLCAGETLSLTPNVVPESYLWSDGTTAESNLVATSGWYWLEGTEGNCTVRDSIFVDFTLLPEIELGNDTTLCPGENITLYAPPSEGTTVEWSTGSTEITIMIDTPGTYSLTVSQDNCLTTNEITIDYFAESALLLGAEVTICEGDALLLEPTWTGPIESVLTWQDGSEGQSFLAEEAGIYQVTLQNNCTTITDDIRVSIEDCTCNVYIPSAFSPNRDGINDQFEVYTPCAISDFSLQIFDRWGGLIFQSTSISEPWNGIGGNKKAEPGVYLYQLQYRDRLGDWQQRSGEVHLVR
ncbi:MAG: gliding motility-associated C-terminal domain-containing protein [Bacteroidota bacterium]